MEVLDEGIIREGQAKKSGPLFTWWVLSIWIFFLLIAAVFKIQRWPGGTIFSLVFGGILCGYMGLRMIRHPKYLALKIVIAVLLLSGSVALLFSYNFFINAVLAFSGVLIVTGFISWLASRKEFKK
jgi:hypothetical protein